MSSCVKCEKCGKCNCKCTCVKEENKANWNWEAFQKLVQNYSKDGKPSQRNDFDELPKRFSLTIVDNGADNDWEIEYRTNINIIELSNILNDYFGIESDVFPRFEDTGWEVIGFVNPDFIEDSDTEE